MAFATLVVAAQLAAHVEANREFRPFEPRLGESVGGPVDLRLLALSQRLHVRGGSEVGSGRSMAQGRRSCQIRLN